MLIENIVHFFRIATARQEPKIGKTLTITKPQKGVRFLTDLIPPLTSARKIAGNLWRVRSMDNYTFFVWVER